MSVSSAFVGAKVVTHFLSNSASFSLTSHSQTAFKPRRSLIHRGSVRYELAASSDAVIADERNSKEKSSIIVIGLSIHTTPVELREKLAIPDAEWPRAIKELCDLHHVEEAAVLCTCNRTEVYFVASSKQIGVKEVTEWMSKIGGISVSSISDYYFVLYNKDAIRHIFEVSAGLDSLVLGEGQILAQVKEVLKVSQGVTGFGRNMRELFKHAIMVGKRVRSETKISEGAVSVSSAAVELALLKHPNSVRSTARVCLIGAGKMGKLVIKHLVSKGFTRIVVVNRSEERVEALREDFNHIEIIYKPLDCMFTCAGEADLIFISTSSPTPLFLKEHVINLPPVGPDVGGKRLFIDISVPRNIGSCVKDLHNTNSYDVDDLKQVVAANQEDRIRKAEDAQEIINEETKAFEAWRDSLQTVPTIRKLRAYAEKIRISELDKCFLKMGEKIY